MTRFLVRLAGYCAITLLACVVAFAAGVTHFDSTCDPDDPEVTECDLAGVEGLAWAITTFFGCVVAAGVNEAVLADRRACARKRPSRAGVRPDDLGEGGGPG
jgi:hypothetical protein